MSAPLSLQARITALEELVGFNDLSSSSCTTEDEAKAAKSSLDHRLTALETLWKLTVTSRSFHTVWDESNHLMQQVHPGDALTYQSLSTSANKNYPILYRRQEVLASRESLKQDLKHLQVILNTLLISSRTDGTTQRQQQLLSEEQVTMAPILLMDNVSIPIDILHSRLDQIVAQMEHVHQRAQALSRRVDVLTDQYHELMMSISNRMVLLDE